MQRPARVGVSARLSEMTSALNETGVAFEAPS